VRIAKYLLAGSLLLPCAQAQRISNVSEDVTPTIKVDVSLVNLLFSVRDGKGRLIANLNQSDFEVREDGKPQQILYFSREMTLPLTLGLLVDSSISQGRLIGKEQQAASAFLAQVIGARDAAFLISFDVSVDLLQDVTGSVSLLEHALGAIRTQGATAGAGPARGPFPTMQTGGTHLYDAVFLASDDVLKREAGRKAIILITDGQDQGSRISRDVAIEAAQRTDVIVYGILFVDPEFYGYGGGYAGDSTLKKMAEETGGRMFRAVNGGELDAAFEQISEELRSQYSIGYSPSNAARDGSYRRIDLRVRGRGLRVQARKGYYAPNDGTAAPSR
jgi:VWFA-related protein